jgi:hypothetical protein
MSARLIRKKAQSSDVSYEHEKYSKNLQSYGFKSYAQFSRRDPGFVLTKYEGGSSIRNKLNVVAI